MSAQETVIKMHNALNDEIKTALEQKLGTLKSSSTEYKILIPAILNGDVAAIAAFKAQDDLDICLKSINRSFFRITKDFGESIDAYREYAKTHNVGDWFSDSGIKCYEYLIKQ
jgi:hypothetical protein